MHIKYKIFLSAMEYLPFSCGDDSKGSFEEIIERYLFSSSYTWNSEAEKKGKLCYFHVMLVDFLFICLNRVLSRSREIKVGKYDKLSDVLEQHRLQGLQKALVIQWLCFTPPSTITDVKDVSAKLLLRALTHRYLIFVYS